MGTKRNTILGVCLLVFGLSAAAHADVFGFVNITNNNAGNAAVGEAQLSVDITDPGGSQVLFTFANAGPAASSIADVYFDDGILLAMVGIDNGDPGVDFAQGASPPNLPGGNGISPAFSATFSADSNPPAQPNGVGPGESLGVLFSLKPGNVFADVLDNMDDKSLRIGIHVQGFANGGSEAFITDGNGEQVPVPGSVLLGAIGLGLVARVRAGARR